MMDNRASTSVDTNSNSTLNVHTKQNMEGVSRLVKRSKLYLERGKSFLDQKGRKYADYANGERLEQVLQMALNKHMFAGAERLSDGTVVVESVRLVDRFNSKRATTGTLYLTATHLIFVDPQALNETWILHMHIQSIEKQPLTTSGSPLQIRCKNFLNVTFVIPRDRDCQEIYTALLQLSQPECLDDLYAFHHVTQELESKAVGWDFFDLQSEYMRMGVPNSHWTLNGINKNYELCDTYPRLLYVPATARAPVLLGSARFRSKARLPVLSYLHRENQASICRCSQPLAGFSARCLEDEQLLQEIRKTNPGSNYMFVVDTRPKINAMANRAAGKGYENENFYTNMKFQFWGIENIHVMRSSLEKLTEVLELKNPSMSAFLGGLESSGWLKHTKAVLDASVFIARAVQEGISVLVHCSDGWDRTAQTCSLAALMLDPYYRSVTGFQALIEKDWLAFGHKFTDRCGLLGSSDSRERAPVFNQFLDCVWQMTQQFPRAFQFNEHFLLTLHDHVTSCQYGTFIGNCEKDRLDLRLHERTYSVWGYVTRHTEQFINPYYSKELELTTPVLIPITHPQVIKFWQGLYCRFESGLHPRESVFDTVCELRKHSTSLEDHSKLLEKRLSALGNLLGRGEESLRRAFSNLSSSESSSDFRSLLLSDGGANSMSNSGIGNVTGYATTGNALVTEANGMRKESDSESGFEDGSRSQMSRSARSEEGGGGGGGEGVNAKRSTNNVGEKAGEHEGMLLPSPEDFEALKSLQVESVLGELQSVAVDWLSVRGVRTCSCATPLTYHQKKQHCWRCGEVFCTRCMERQVPLPGHLSYTPRAVCRSCAKALTHAPSSDNLQRLLSNVMNSDEVTSCMTASTQPEYDIMSTSTNSTVTS